MHDAVQATVHRAAVVIHVTEIRASRAFLILCHMQSVTNQFVDAFVFRRGNGNDRNAQHFFHLIDADGAAVAAHLVHHVECKHHRNVQFHQLHG